MIPNEEAQVYKRITSLEEKLCKMEKKRNIGGREIEVFLQNQDGMRCTRHDFDPPKSRLLSRRREIKSELERKEEQIKGMSFGR